MITAVFPEIGDGSGLSTESLNYVLGTALFNVAETTYRKDGERFMELRNYLAHKRIRTIHLASL